MTVSDFQVVAGTERFPATDLVAAARFAAAYTVATKTNASVRRTTRTCGLCGDPIVGGLLACCTRPACVDTTSAEEKRRYDR